MNKQKSFLEFEIALVPGSIKAAAREAGASSRDLWQIPRSKIRTIDNFNPRTTASPSYKAKIRELANSMTLQGFYQSEPIEVYVAREGDENVFYLTDGHRRLAGYDLAISEGAKLSEMIPAVPCEKGTTLEDLTVGFVRHNNTRVDLSPYELGVVIKRLVTYNWEMPKICSHLDITSQYADSLLMLIGADRRVREMVINEQVVAATAVEALRKHGAKAYEVLQAALERAQSTGKTKVTRSALPDVAFKKSVSKAAPSMFTTLRDVRNDPGFKSIAPDLRARLEELVMTLDKLEADANADADSHEESEQAAKKVA